MRPLRSHPELLLLTTADMLFQRTVRLLEMDLVWDHVELTDTDGVADMVLDGAVFVASELTVDEADGGTVALDADGDRVATLNDSVREGRLLERVVVEVRVDVDEMLDVNVIEELRLSLKTAILIDMDAVVVCDA